MRHGADRPRLALLAGLGAVALAVFAAGGDGGGSPPATRDWGPTHYVDGEGIGGRCDDRRGARRARSPATPWCSLARALRAVPAPSVIEVRRGDYPPLEVEDLAPADYVTVRARPGERVTVAGVLLRRVAHLRVEGLRVTGRFDVIEGAHHLELSGNLIREQRSGIYFNGYGSPPDGEIGDVLIEGNRIERIDYTGEQGVGEGYGIVLAGICRRVTIRGNTIRSVAEDYIQGGGSHLTVERNRFLGPSLKAGHAQAHSDLWQIFGTSDHIAFRGNVARGTGTHTGLLFQFAGPDRPYGQVTIENNLFDHASEGYEMQIYDTKGLRIAGNTAVGSAWGVLLRDDRRVPNGSGYVIVNNVFDASDGPAFSTEALWGVEDYNLITRTAPGATGYGEHDVLDRPPGFVDGAGGDYRLAPGSPAVDAGTSAGPPRDLEGRARVDDPDAPNHGGGEPPFHDIGVHERGAEE